MRLTFEQIKNITVGALEIWEQDGAVHFGKCTSKQVEAWYQVEKKLGERAECTTGIRLDFHTNSKVFAFTSETIGNYEIYIDNVLTYAYFKEDFQEDKYKKIELNGEEHRITLYLPSHDAPGVLSSVELEDGASLLPHRFDCKILFIGDSITQGWDSTWDSLSYANHVSRFFNAESVIQGIGGAYYQDTTFDATIAFEPDIVVVAYGTNDWGSRKLLDIGKAHVKNYLDQLVARYGDKKLFGISPIWRADYEKFTPMGSFESWTSYVKEQIVNHDMILIDGQTLTPHLPKFYSDAYLHPDTKGFGCYALNLISQMLKDLC